MARVPNAVEILPKIWTAWVGCTNATDDRWQTDDRRQTDDGRAIAYSEREREFMFAKNQTFTRGVPITVAYIHVLAPSLTVFDLCNLAQQIRSRHIIESQFPVLNATVQLLNVVCQSSHTRHVFVICYSIFRALRPFDVYNIRCVSRIVPSGPKWTPNCVHELDDQANYVTSGY